MELELLVACEYLGKKKWLGKRGKKEREVSLV